MPAIECPTCKRQIRYQALTEAPFRPFCSRRCKLIDLGHWLNEDFRVTEELPPDGLENQPGMDPPTD